jgi:hypothetical protein
MNDFFDFDGEDLNNIKEGEEFFISLVEKALTSKNSDFRFIRS